MIKIAERRIKTTNANGTSDFVPFEVNDLQLEVMDLLRDDSKIHVISEPGIGITTLLSMLLVSQCSKFPFTHVLIVVPNESECERIYKEVVAPAASNDQVCYLKESTSVMFPNHSVLTVCCEETSIRSIHGLFCLYDAGLPLFRSIAFTDFDAFYRNNKELATILAKGILESDGSKNVFVESNTGNSSMAEFFFDASEYDVLRLSKEN